MKSMYLQSDLFNIAIIGLILFQIYNERGRYKDSMLFSRLLIMMVGILVVDTIGWQIDGSPIGGQLWFTSVIDGLNLILTTAVCWSWVQYAQYIAMGDSEKYEVPWYKDISSLLLAAMVVLTVISFFNGSMYSIDDAGVYHRGEFYFVHILICAVMLVFSWLTCMYYYAGEKNAEHKKELRFVMYIIVIPLVGTLIQTMFYGFMTIWLSMTFMILAVYLHIQNKNTEKERKQQNEALQVALAKAQKIIDANEKNK